MERWRRIDTAQDEEARALLATCCGAPRWVAHMAARRPFGSLQRVLEAARQEWFALGEDEWREAFTHHPRIGDIEDLQRRFAATRALSEREQAGVSGASQEILSALLEGNREYEARFGYIFIVCAAGKRAEEMLSLLRARLENPPEIEIRVAAEEHARICELRLQHDDEPNRRQEDQEIKR